MFKFIDRFAKENLERPKLLLAGAFFLLPFITAILIGLVVGIPISTEGLFIQLVREVAIWFVSSALLYFLVYALRGKDVKGKFPGIMAALSIRYLLWSLLVLISFFALYFALPGFFAKLGNIDVEGSTDQVWEELVAVSQSISQQDTLLLFFAFGLVLLLVALFVIFNVYLVLKISGHASNENPKRAFFVLILFLALQWLILSFF